MPLWQQSAMSFARTEPGGPAGRRVVTASLPTVTGPVA
jgi:hypothetical protein